MRAVPPDPAGFAGTWDVRRRIVDHRAGAAYGFEGRAILGRNGFEESGTVRLGAHTFEAVRSYGLAMHAASVALYFPNGNDFVTLELRPSQRVLHLCGDDTYEGRFFFRGADEWAEAWRVSGPQKRYASLTRYRRAIGGA